MLVIGFKLVAAAIASNAFTGVAIVELILLALMLFRLPLISWLSLVSLPRNVITYQSMIEIPH